MNKLQGVFIMLIQSDYHIHASFDRVKAAAAVPGPTAAEQLAAAREAGSVYVGIVEHCNDSPKHPFYCLEELAAEFYSPEFPGIMSFSASKQTLKMTAATSAAKMDAKSWDSIISSVLFTTLPNPEKP